MKKEKDLHAELAKKKFKVPHWLPYGIYHIVGRTHLLGQKYHPHIEIKDKIAPGPCFYIFNHQSRRDHTFIERAAWPRRVNILCEYNEFFRSHLHFALRMNGILPKKPYAMVDILGMRAMNQVLKQGGCIAFSPEGTSSIFGCNQPICTGTGRLLKFYKYPVYCAYIRGSYLTNNKISEIDHYGEVYLTQYLLFSPEDLAKLTPEEIEDKINEAFHHDDYEWNKTARVKYKNVNEICKNLNDICYKCPKCGEELHMIAEKNYIKCEKCGNGAYMNEYFDFIPFDDTCVIPESPVKWMEFERVSVIKEIRKDPEYSYKEHMNIGYLPKDHWVKKPATGEPCGEGEFTVDHKGVHFVGTRLGEPWSFDMDYKSIYTVNNPVNERYFAIYVNGEYIEFIPDHPNAVKIAILIEEMHRLHVNDWKAFPWWSWMYEEK